MTRYRYQTPRNPEPPLSPEDDDERSEEEIRRDEEAEADWKIDQAEEREYQKRQPFYR